MLMKRLTEPFLRERTVRDPYTLLRQLASDMDRMFADAPWPTISGKGRELDSPALINWVPQIDVFEKDGRLVTRIDLPGMKKEEVKVEVTDGHLAISGERKATVEEKTDQFYRSEREYGQFYRAVPLPDGVKPEDVKAVFVDGVLDVSVPIPVAPELKVHQVQVEDGPKTVKPAV
jgi:HSP20 family protein